jgi:hypothetical protein
MKKYALKATFAAEIICVPSQRAHLQTQMRRGRYIRGKQTFPPDGGN